MEEFLSVVIPAFNEESRIGPTLIGMFGFLEDNFRNFEIVVVDDGSTDNTRSVVEDLSAELDNVRLISNPVNHGKGYAVGQGMLASRGDLVLFSDADMSTPVDELKKLMPFCREGFDIVIGSRGLAESDIRVRQSWYRERMGKMFNLLVRLLAVRGITDTQCGFKLFRGEVAQTLFRKTMIKGFAFDVEVLFLAEKFGYEIKEVPIRWLNSPCSKVKLIGDSVRMFLELLRIRAYYSLGRYAPVTRKG